MGVVQKIFYFHVPCAIMLFVATFVCAGGSIAYLFKGSEAGDRLAAAAGELGVLFGACVLVSGPLWGRKAWGVYWQWDARLTSVAAAVPDADRATCWRASTAGRAGSELAAALGLFAAVNVPLVYKSVDIWRTIHPQTTVVRTLDPGMRPAFWASFALDRAGVRDPAGAAHAPGEGARAAGRAAPGSRRSAGGTTSMNEAVPVAEDRLHGGGRAGGAGGGRWRRSSRRSTRPRSWPTTSPRCRSWALPTG